MTVSVTSRPATAVDEPSLAGGSPPSSAAVERVAIPTAPEVGADRRGRRRLPRGVERLLGVVVFFALWEVAARVGWISPKVLAPPSTVLTTGRSMLADGTLTRAMWASVQRVWWGLVIGIPVGALLALSAGLSRLGDDLVDANVQMLRFVPIIGLEPLLILWLGIGETAKISLIVLGVAFPVYVNTYAAVRSVDPGLLELSRSLGLTRGQQLRRVVLPGSMPGFLVGVRLATAAAWLLLVFAEQINATSGLGYLMIRAQTFFQSDVIVVCLVVYAILGLITDGAVRALEHRALRWQPGR